MKGMFLGLALVLVGSVFAQQQQPPTGTPPYTTPPTFPPGRMPPDTKAPPPQGLSTPQVQQQIQDKINSEPALANTKVGVMTDDRSVTLTGTVDSEEQRDIALRLARSYSGERKIVNKIKVAGRA
jgi:hyperosmotically inducible protein